MLIFSDYSVDLAKDQSGCRFLQKKIDEGNVKLNQNIFTIAIFRFVDLMNDPFGNYLAQKIAETCTYEQMVQIIHNFGKDTVNICTNQHGTRSIQKIIEVIKEQEHFELIIHYMKDKIRTLAEDINGNHVIQKILVTWPEKWNQFIFDVMIAKCREIVCHKHGCCVMQKCIDGATPK
jgi:hypothetical protein